MADEKDLQDEVNELLDETVKDAVVSDEVSEPVVDEEKKVEGVVETPPGGVPPSEPVVEIPVVEAPPVEEESPTAKLQKIIEAQAETIANLQKPTVSETIPPASIESEDFNKLLEEMDLDEVLDNKANFSKFLKQAMTFVKEQTKQEILTSIPQVVGNHVQQQVVMRDVANTFYETHPELKRVKKYVSTVANEVSAQNPGWDVPTVLAEAAKRAKEALQLQGVVSTPGPVKPVAPALPGSGGVRAPAAVPSKLQSEIDDLIND
jgi:hypothetical protein